MSSRTQRRAAMRKAAKIAHKADPATTTSETTSEAQIAANRENSTHSTGPASDAGKAIVSQNRRVHGLNYNAATFTVLPCENQADYDHLLLSLQEEQDPQDTVEELLVLSMAQHRWLLDRATRLQETCFDPETAQVTDQKLFSLYLRYATTHERAFHKCLNDLLKLRTTEQKSQIGFESETRSADMHQLSLLAKHMQNLYYQSKFLGSLSNDDFQKFIELSGLELKKAA